MNWSVNLEGGRDLCVGGFKFGVWTQFLFINKKDVHENTYYGRFLKKLRDPRV